MALKHYNNWSSTLAVATSDSYYETLLHIPTADANKLEFGDPEGETHRCYLTLIEVDEDGVEVDWEIVEAYARGNSGGNATLTVDRGFDGTVAKVWPIGTRIEARLIAYVVNELAGSL